MIRRPLPTPQRRGFTVIELLVVIGIILILAGLLVGAVSRVTVLGKRVATGSEIAQLSVACDRFKADFEIYPPQTFTVPATYSSTDTSCQVLKKMFPRWNPNVGDAVPLPVTQHGQILNSNQCLVYFLFGPEGTGWNPSRPQSAAQTSTSKKGPYFDFQSSRLSSSFPNTYVDTWGTPYAFLTSGSTGYIGPVTVAGFTIQPFTTKFNGIDKPVNPNGVQIISAGADMKFGVGGDWSPGVGNYVANEDGGDDLANFNSGSQLSAKP